MFLEAKINNISQLNLFFIKHSKPKLKPKPKNIDLEREN